MGGRVKISVVVPIYGVERFIGKFAESLLGQSYDNVEFIFVNDGTKDGSMYVLRTLIDERFSHLRDRIIIIDKENEGCPVARRTGLAHATGEYVMHADPDDWYEPDAIETIATVAEETQADIICFDYFRGKRIKNERAYAAGDKYTFIRDIYNHRASGTVWNKCMKRSLYLNNRIYYPLTSCAEDMCLSVQLIGYSSSIVHIPKPLYHYRRDNPTAVTRKNPKYRRQRATEKFLNLYEFFRDTPDDLSPVSVIYDDIMMKAGWSVVMYGLDHFSSRPYLADKIGRMPLSLSRETPVVSQLITKIYAFLHRIKNR